MIESGNPSESVNIEDTKRELGIAVLETAAKEILSVAQRLIGKWHQCGIALDGDRIVQALLNRAWHLISGIKTLADDDNWDSAATLVRPLFDCCLILVALGKQKNPGKLEKHWLNGKRIKDFKDEKGKKLKDMRLREYLLELIPECNEFYVEASRYIHFSDKHLSSTFTPMEKENGYKGHIGKGSPSWTMSDKRRLVNAVQAIAESLVRIVEHACDNPARST